MPRRSKSETSHSQKSGRCNSRATDFADSIVSANIAETASEENAPTSAWPQAAATCATAKPMPIQPAAPNAK